MIKYFFFFPMFLVFNGSRAQNSYLNYRMAIKAYNQSTYERQTRSFRTSDTTTTYFETNRLFQIIQPTLAFQWKSGKSNFHEVEISGLRVGKRETQTEQVENATNKSETVAGQDVFQTSLAFRYEYQLNFKNKGDRKLVPCVGFGAGTIFNRYRSEPHFPNSFPSSNTQINLRLFLTPRLIYYLGSKLFLDVNVPITITDLNTTIFKVKNPAFTPVQQKYTDQTFTGFPKIYSLRIGVGLKL
ncbi:MAG: hypothetical protein ACYC1Q_01305 [Bacteroidia bacterium]